jgi:hypothetical protein
MRQAYAWCKPVEGLDIRVGQQWDLFSPLNPTTNNTNANLWYNGNHGFRRPQFQLRYGLELGAVVPELQASIGEAAKEDGADGNWLGDDNLSELPMVQYRLGLGLPHDIALGFSGMYAAFGEDKEITSTGVAADLTLPLHDLFALKGELAWGRNLNNANLFTIGGSGSEDNDVVTLGFWVNAVSKPLDFLHVVLGAAQEHTIDGLRPGAGDVNLTLYGDLIFPIGKHFSLAAEYQWLRTKWAGQDEPYTAGIVDVAGKVVF